MNSRYTPLACLFFFLLYSPGECLNQAVSQGQMDGGAPSAGLSEILADETFSITPTEAMNAAGYKPHTDGSVMLEAGSTYWLRQTLSNPTDKAVLRYLRLTASDLYAARLYVESDQGLKEVRSKPNRRTALFPVMLPPEKTTIVYLFLDRRYLPLTLKVQFLSAAELLAVEKSFDFSGGLYTGAGLLYLLLALLQTLLLRNRESVFFYCYVAGSMLYLFYSRAEPLAGVLHNFGLGYLFDTLPYASVAVSTIGHLGLFYVIFRLWKLPLLSTVVNGLQIGCALLFAMLLTWPIWVDYWFYSYQWLVQVVAVLSVVGLACILFCGGWLYARDKDRDQGLFLLTFLPVLLLVLCIWLMEAGVLPRMDAVYDNAPGLLIFYESTVLGGLLVYRFIRERSHLRNALDNERREIIHDLHSGLLPEVDALRELNERMIRPLEPNVYARLDQLSGEISEDVRTLMWTLGRKEGEMLDELVGRLREKVHSRFADLPVQTKFVTSPAVFPENIPVPFFVSYHLFYLVKEVTNNAAKHASATAFNCNLTYSGGAIELMLSDDGCGFDYRPDIPGSGYGLVELRQRAERMGGVLALETAVGSGTTVRLSVPRLDVAVARGVDAARTRVQGRGWKSKALSLITSGPYPDGRDINNELLSQNILSADTQASLAPAFAPDMSKNSH